jgi:hypothetical protein
MRRLTTIFCFALLVGVAAAQTTVTTTGGTANTVPLFTGSSTIANSTITQSNGHLGIGFASPSSKLDVLGDIDVKGGNANSLTYNTSNFGLVAGYASPEAGRLIFGDGTGWKYSISKGTAASPTDLVTFQDNGYVGIGTTSPAYPLDVSGTIRVQGSGNGFVFPDGSKQTTAAITTGGTITGVTAGTGLTGGGTSGNVTLSVDGNVVRNNVSNTFTAQQNFSGQPISVTNSAVLVNNGNSSVYALDGTVLSGISLGVWNKQFNNTTWATGSVIAGWAGSGQTQVFHVDTSGTTYTYNAFVAGGLDYSEYVQLGNENTQYSPGDVIVIDATRTSHFSVSNQPRSHLVAGVYSTKPGVIGSLHPMDATPKDHEVPLALVGRVPCKVSTENGPISVGDLLVTSSTPGYAMRADEDAKPGTILGKALEPLSSSAGLGSIEVLLALQ